MIAVLLKLSREDNSALAPLMRVLPKIGNYDSASTVRNFNFGQLLPRDKQAFYRYLGSKTTPPCSPVTFIIFADTLDISPFQVNLKLQNSIIVICKLTCSFFYSYLNSDVFLKIREKISESSQIRDISSKPEEESLNSL